MYEDEQTQRPMFRGNETVANSWADQLRAWAEEKISNYMERALNLALSIIIPIIQLLALSALIVGISVIVNIYLRRVMVPKALIHERVYFNYVTESPTAVVNLFSAGKQWDYMRDGAAADAGSGRRFLKVDNGYDIHCTFTVAKSARNYDISITPITLKMVDTTGATVAKSVRAIVIPYQHPMSLLLESVTFFPWRATRYMDTAETADIWVNLMSDYKEPGPLMPPTEAIELTLSVPAMDMSHAYVTVMPRLRGIVYFMYYHPVLSFVVGCVLVSGIQAVIYAFVAVVVFAVRYVFQATANGRTDPIQAQYARARRRRATDYPPAPGNGPTAFGTATADTAAGMASQFATSGADRGRYQTQVGIDQEARAEMREFVNIHIPGGAGAGGDDDVTDEVFSRGVIDTINMELLQSRELNRSAAARAQTRRAITSPSGRREQQHPHTSSGAGGAHAGLHAPVPTSSSPEDWDINAAMCDARGSNTFPLRRHPGAVPMTSPEHPHTPAVDSPSSTGNSGAHTPHSGRGRNGSDFDTSEESEDLDKVFQNDFFNSFFPFLRRKGSGQENKKDR